MDTCTGFSLFGGYVRHEVGMCGSISRNISLSLSMDIEFLRLVRVLWYLVLVPTSTFTYICRICRHEVGMCGSISNNYVLVRLSLIARLPLKPQTNFCLSYFGPQSTSQPRPRWCRTQTSLPPLTRPQCHRWQSEYVSRYTWWIWWQSWMTSSQSKKSPKHWIPLACKRGGFSL